MADSSTTYAPVPTRYGFYSAKAEALMGSYAVYCAPDGSEVVVTFVDRDPTGTSYVWDDVVKRGPVGKFVRKVVTNAVKAQRFDEGLEAVLSMGRHHENKWRRK